MEKIYDQSIASLNSYIAAILYHIKVAKLGVHKTFFCKSGHSRYSYYFVFSTFYAHYVQISFAMKVLYIAATNVAMYM